MGLDKVGKKWVADCDEPGCKKKEKFDFDATGSLVLDKAGWDITLNGSIAVVKCRHHAS